MRPLVLAVLLVSPAAAQLRKITPVPPPAFTVKWPRCSDAPIVGRFSGMLKCTDGVARHLETLVYQRNAGDEGRLLTDLSLSRSAADRGGSNMSGAMTLAGASLAFTGQLSEKNTEEPAPLQGTLTPLPSPPGGALYDVKFPRVTGRLTVLDAKKGHVFLTHAGPPPVTCEGDLKKTQTFKLVCGQ